VRGVVVAARWRFCKRAFSRGFGGLEIFMIRKLSQRYLRNNFAQGVISVAGGTIVGQGVSVLTSPILTRLYTPEAVGKWGLFLSFVGVATVGGALRYEVAIVAAKDEEDAFILAGHALFLSILTSIVGGVVFAIFSYRNILGYGIFPGWMGMGITLAIMGTTWGQILRFWFIRQREFRKVGYFVAGKGILRSFSQMLWFPWRSVGLIFGEVIGRLGSLGILLRDFPFRRALKNVLTVRGRATVLWRFKEYPLIFLPSAFVDTLALMAPVPVFTAVYGVKVGGMLALAQRVVSVPLLFLGSAVADVFYGEIAEAMRRSPKAAFSLFLKSTFRLSGTAFLLGGALWFLAPLSMEIIFGPEWVLSGSMLAVMVPWFVAMLIVSPISRLVFLSRYPWAKLIYDFFALVGVTLPLWWHSLGPLEALRFVAWIQAGLYGLYWLVLLFSVRQGLEVR